jgi:hypothetical protein
MVYYGTYRSLTKYFFQCIQKCSVRIQIRIRNSGLRMRGSGPVRNI